MLKRTFLGGRQASTTRFAAQAFRKSYGTLIDDLAAITSANGAETIDPLPFLSPNGICISADDNGPIRSDGCHLRCNFVRDHVTYLDATVADGDIAIGDVTKSQKKPVEAPSASARPTQWRLVATKDYPAVLTFPDTMPDAMRVEFGTLPTLEPWRVRLASQPTEVRADAKYRVAFRIRADKPREVIFTVREAQEPWANLGLYGRIPVTDQWQSVTREFTAKADASNALFSFDLGGSDIAVEIADVSFRPASLKPSAARAAEGPRPNLLFIIFDDLNDSVSGMGGHPQAKTPNIDRLMARGVRFTNAHCSSPICGPSRASLLTGLYPHTSGYFGWEQQQRPWRANPVLKNTKTFIQHAVAAGYTASGGGKIFHNGHEDGNAWRGRDDVDRSGPKAGHGPFATPVDFGQKFPWIVTEYGSTAWPGYMAFGSLNDVPVIPADPTRGFPGVRGWADYRFVSDANRDPLPDEQLARWAADQLAAGKAHSPFLMCIGFNRPHQPEVVPQEYFDLFPLDSIQIADRLDNDIADCAPEFRGRDMQFWTAAAGLNMYQRLAARGDEYLRHWTQAYLASVAFADAQLGLVLDALAASGHVDDTLVVLTSDHGYHMGQKDYVFKNTVWEPSTRVPLVVAGPGVARNAECKAPVTLIDIYPTLIDYGQMPGDPHGPLQPLDGHSLRPLLEDPESGRWDGPPVALTAVAPPRQPAADLSEQRLEQNYTIRSDRYRYIRGCRGGEELYDHLEDPHEWRNLAADSDHRATLEKMRKQMDAVLGFRLADELTLHQSDPDVQPISDATSPATGDQRR